ncbi:MAG: nucleotidyltransferase [Lachnospiraceae bacterium]|nr:nucleotidyltransferase [Lachnospiraceae bacterium]
MKTVGIIAEYNPFHNGHLYHLQQAKALSNADFAIVVLSGDFTQRGTPALLDKYARCEMALCCGADLVIELPVCFATGSAEYFAKGAVSILSNLKTDALCFGSECGSIDALRRTARVLADEPEPFRNALMQNLRKGMSFPAARSLALSQYLTGADYDDSLLKSPNNILGVEYLKALIKLDSPMEVYTLPRQGAGYSDDSLQEQHFCSALALRHRLLDGGTCDEFSPFIPKAALHILERELASRKSVHTDDFSSMLFYRLLQLQAEGYSAFADVSDALSDKMAKLLEHYILWSQFCSDLLKSKDLTHSRLNRSLLHILLNIKKQDLCDYEASGNAQYARVLGFRADSKPLFSELSKKLPLITKLSDADRLLSPVGMRQLQQDIFAAHLYESVKTQKTGGPMLNEYRRQIVIVP